MLCYDLNLLYAFFVCVCLPLLEGETDETGAVFFASVVTLFNATAAGVGVGAEGALFVTATDTVDLLDADSGVVAVLVAVAVAVAVVALEGGCWVVEGTTGRILFTPSIFEEI